MMWRAMSARPNAKGPETKMCCYCGRGSFPLQLNCSIFEVLY